ncbi:MAG: tRNA (adenosine(37)-N6)-threonylcarbamoyltransferase complex dimerization subunit type 1 TsaB [Myxococcota bacterium]
MAPDPGTLLALETASGRGSVALETGGEIRERVLPPDRATAESLLPAIDALLAEAGLRLDAVGGFAVSIGPGSFTGLRIGVATVKGLCFGSDLPVVPVPTLAALALGAAPGPGPVVAVLDARRDELYAAGYADPADPEPDVLAEGLYAGAELAERLPAGARLVGDAAGLSCVPLRRGLAPGVAVQEPGGPARASDVARLGRRLLGRQAAGSAGPLVPRYVRRAQAEVLRTGLPTEG